MSRPLAGIACRIRIPLRQYQAVALVMREKSHVIRLLHRERGLSLDIEEFENLATAEDYCDRLAGFLNLPPVTACGTPAQEDEDIVRGPACGRRSRAISIRRPRFLRRRRAGTAGQIVRIEGREIIARN